MIHRNNIYRWLLMLAILPLSLTGCWEDDNYDICPDQAEKIQLTLTLPEQTRIATNTRATSSRLDYSIVNNINLLLVNKNNQIEKVYYFNEMGMTPDDGNVSMTRSLLPMKPEDGDNKRHITIVGEEGEFDNISTIYTVANYGKAIDMKAVSTVDQLKALKQTASDGQPNKQGDCMMFGSTNQLNNGTISLKRTLAMFSVKMDGTNLKEGVRITPKRISLHNVPKSCFIGTDNKINNKNESAKDGQVVDVTNADGWGALTKERKTIGGHEKEDGTIPMFMFENRQGINNKITSDEVTKAPEGYTGNSPKELQSFLDKDQKYTYILIEADYYYQDPHNSNVGVHGNIAYRFLLGNNIYNDFNIDRNNYYQITLSLTDKGGAKEDGKTDENGNLLINDKDLSWRVEMNIKDWGFVKDDFDFDAHATHGYLEIVGEDWSIGGSSASWIKFYSNEKGWIEPTHYGDCGKNGKIEFYIQPWSWYVGGFDKETKDISRQITLELTKKGHETQYVTIKQWTPIYIKTNVWVERFEENEEELAWGYMDSEMSGSGNVTQGANQGNKSFSFGTSTTFQGMQNTWYMYYNTKNESPAQIYCYRKGGYDLGEGNGLPSNVNADFYAMPDAETMKAIMEYEYKGSNPFQPIRTDKEYWTGSANNNNKKETYYCTKDSNTGEVVLKTTTQRNAKKRVRAIYRINPY